MRHRLAGRHLSRTSAHNRALRRNLAQSLFQYGQIETTLIKAKEVRPFVERLITLARKDSLTHRQRALSLLGDRAVITKDEQEKYDAMSDAQRNKVLRAKSGRRHRSGKVPASYNKKKIPFVAHSVIDRLFKDVAPKFVDRPGGYTRIIRLSKRRVGDNSELALLQLVGQEEKSERVKKTVSPRRQKAADRVVYFEQGKVPKRRRVKGGKTETAAKKGTVPGDRETSAGAEGQDAGVEK